MESCADPSIIRGQTPADPYWYLFCTSDPIDELDRDQTGAPAIHLMPVSRSSDLVTWTYTGDVFARRPNWVHADAGLWAPDIQYMNERYYLYYTATETILPGGGSAIGVATSASPAGPWTDSGGPVIPPLPLAGRPGAHRWVYDPAVLHTDDGSFLFFGSFAGGISARRLSPDGLHTDAASEMPVAIANRYEAPFVVRHDGFYYLFLSATDCCNGPLTGHAVFAGRSASPLGPYVDREGVPLLAARVGGTPVLTMNGDRWVGPGHIAVISDLGGQDWALYGAIDREQPYFGGERRLTRRAALLDRLDWIDGWPAVRGGLGPSDTPQPAPVLGDGRQGPRSVESAVEDRPGDVLPALSDEFDGPALDARWEWVRPLAPDAVRLVEGRLWLRTSNTELYAGTNNAPVLTRAAPPGDYVVETRMSLDVPGEGCCYNFVQAGVLVYGDDDSYVKLVHVAIWETRQTEFALERHEERSGYPRYGGSVAGPPGDDTYLRIVCRRGEDGERYTAYTSRDGRGWVRGATWTSTLGATARIGLGAFGGEGFTAGFDYVRVYNLPPQP